MLAIRVGQVFGGEQVLPDAGVVLVEGGRILDVQPHGMTLPDGCAVADHPHATLLPGLIDTHVHLCGDSGLGALDRLPTFSDEELTAVIEEALRAHLATGVTTGRGGPRRRAGGDRPYPSPHRHPRRPRRRC
jgi:imidazolonepropionase-like amidohydrolase